MFFIIIVVKPVSETIKRIYDNSIKSFKTIPLGNF